MSLSLPLSLSLSLSLCLSLSPSVFGGVFDSFSFLFYVCDSKHGQQLSCGTCFALAVGYASLFQPKTATLEDIAIAPMKGIDMLASKSSVISEVQAMSFFRPQGCS